MPKADKLVSRLKEIVGEANIVSDRGQLKAYALDGKTPRAVVFPGSIDELSKIVAYAYQEQKSIIPMGNGTKLEMGGIPQKVDLVLSTRRFNRITDCDPDNLTLSVEGGITLNEVQRRLAGEGRGYFLPLDPQHTGRATLGGIVATNSSGPKRLLYGAIRDLIIGMKTVFPNGDIIVSGGKTVKNVSGYDMCKLLIGSFGTLGIIYEMTFKLLPLPESEATVLTPFMDLNEAVGFVHEIIHSQLTPASIETLNGVAVKKMRSTLAMPSEGNYLVAVGLEGVGEAVERQVSQLCEMGKGHGGLEAVSLDSERHRAFWIGIRDFAERLKGEYPNLVSLKSNFLISKWGEVLRSYEKIAEETGFDSAFICHSGNGILYSHVITERSVRSEAHSLVELIGRLTSEAVRNEGNLVVEMCPLVIKKKVDVWGEPRSDSQIMHRIKEEIDPVGILNPGRFAGGI